MQIIFESCAFDGSQMRDLTVERPRFDLRCTNRDPGLGGPND